MLYCLLDHQAGATLLVQSSQPHKRFPFDLTSVLTKNEVFKCSECRKILLESYIRFVKQRGDPKYAHHKKFITKRYTLSRKT